MDAVRIDELDRIVSAAAIKRSVGAAVGAEGLALNYYELDPGESLSFGYHAHADQEELYYVQAGRVAFETDAGVVTVEAGGVARSPPGEFHRGVNAGEGRAVVLALGAPAEMGETEIRRDCPECGERTRQAVEVAGGPDLPPAELQTTDAEGVLVARCVECGTETGRFE